MADTDGWTYHAPGAAPPPQQPASQQQGDEEQDPDAWDEALVAKMGGLHGFAYACNGPLPQPCGAPPPCFAAPGGGAPKLAAKCAFGAAAAAPMMMANVCAARMPMPCPPPAPCAAQVAAFGFRTGGAQDVCNFRENVQAGKLPLPSDVTYEGVVKDYFFSMEPSEGTAGERCTDLFFPTYSLALAADPLLAAGPAGAGAGGATAAAPAPMPAPPDIFLSVGLDSGMTQFRRPRLNLLVLLDVSGSMDCTFDRYFYDATTGEKKELTEEESRHTKLDVAKEVLLGMADKLEEGDSFSVALFSDAACVPKPLGPMRSAKLDSIKAGVKALRTIGGTNLQAGLDASMAEFRRYEGFRNADPVTTESRLVILTDAEPNEGDFTGTGLLARLKANALDGIHTTFIGVGLDFNSRLVEEISKVKGANYYSVHSPGEFKRRLCDDFDCMVSPLVFDLALRVAPASLAGGWRILHAYGSPNPEDSALSRDGSVMKIHTLFPSPRTEEGVKGGVVLLRMEPPPTPTPLSLSATYRDRSGAAFASHKEVPLPAGLLAGGGEGPAPPQLFQSSGVRKAVALARYTDALQSWLVDEWGAAAEPPPPSGFWLGLCQRLLPPRLAGRASPWERTSRPLHVGPRAAAAFRALLPYLRGEVAAVGDTSMGQEVDLLAKVVRAAGAE